MRLLLTVTGLGDRSFDIDSAATIAELVDVVADGGEQTFLVQRSGVRLGRDDKVVASDLRSADVVEIVRSTGSVVDEAPRSQAAATLRVVDGPNVGAEYPLRFGINTVGRGERNDVTLKDSLASRTHAHVTVDDQVTIADSGSTNGVLIGTEPITQPTVLSAGTAALVGDSWIEVEHHNRTPGLDEVVGNTVDFNRPPRISQPYKGKKVKLPAVPTEPRKQRLPMASFLAPLLMAGALFGFFRWSGNMQAQETRENCRAQAEVAIGTAEDAIEDLEERRLVLIDAIDIAQNEKQVAEEADDLVIELEERIRDLGRDVDDARQAVSDARGDQDAVDSAEAILEQLEDELRRETDELQVQRGLASLALRADNDIDTAETELRNLDNQDEEAALALAAAEELRLDEEIEECVDANTRSNPLRFMMIIFLAMSPVMIIGSTIERKRSGRIEFEQERDEFKSNVKEALAGLDNEIETEFESRLREAPKADEIPQFVGELSPRLWERGPDDSDVLTVRLGRADQRSRITVEVPDGGSRELRKDIVSIPEKYEIVEDVPVLVNLVEAGGLGVSGAPDQALPIALSVVSQVAGMHSPSELLIAAMIGEDARSNWEWMKWLPHANIDNSPLGGPHLASTADTCHNLLGRLDQLIGARIAQVENPSSTHRLVMPGILVVIDETMVIERHRLTRLLEHGPTVGVFFLWLATSRHRLPRPVGAYLDIPREGDPLVGYTTTDEVIEPVALEPIDVEAAERVARALSPVKDVSGRFAGSSQVPSRVNLVDILEGPQMLVDPSIVLQRWSQESRSLRAPVGSMAGSTFSLDVRHDGPHALVAGTTGAGKSELLQSWIASLALTYGPEKITFLLVDYKGGSAFKDINKLPHTVGMVTDLDTNGVRRALTSLNAELHHREHILAEANCSDLAEMEKKKIAGAPPSLLIVVDEFAALIQEVPEFVEGMVNVAQRGRSLGLHLILATQRPGGVITPQVRANTNLRIALRMADESESSDVINSKIAANIERSLPGRGVARIGPKELISFQSAYVGGITDPDGVVETVELGEFMMDGVERVEVASPQVDVTGKSDLENLVDVVNTAHEMTGEPLPRKPWLNPLGDVYELAMLPRPTSDTEVLLGAIDVPESQQQKPYLWMPDDEGSIGIVGTSGSGKTVALSTFAASVAFCGDDPMPSVFAMDFAGRGLLRIDDLPHVSTVVLDDDEERLRRLLGDLEKTLNERSRKFAAARAGSLPEYRSLSGEQLNRHYLLIDGLSAFYTAHDRAGMGKLTQIVQRLVREGRQFGLHVVAGATRRQDVGSVFARTFSRWLILRQGSIDDYRNLEVASDALNEESPPGRALVGNSIAQLAVLGGSPYGDVQAEAIDRFGEQLRERGVDEAAQVRTLPHRIAADDVPADTWCVDDESLEPVLLPASLDVLQIAGPRSSGKSVAMWRAAATISEPFDSIDLFTAKTPTLPIPAEWQVWKADTEGAGQRLQDLAAGSERRLVLFDDLGPLSDSMLGMQLEELIRHGRSPGLTIMLTIENVDARSSFKPIIREVRSYRTSLLLRPDPLADGELAGTELPRMKTHTWPPGRGFLVLGNAMQIVQVVDL